MAKFCTKCGKKLEEGKKCDCEAKKEIKKVKEQEAVSVNVQAYFNSYVEIIKNIFKKPVDTIKKYATEENYILGLIAIVINSLISGTFLYCFLKEIVGSISSSFGIYSSFLGFGNVDIPFAKTVLIGLLFMVVGFLVTALMIYVIAGSLLKDEISFKKSISLVGVCSVFTAVTTLVSIVLIYISVKLTIILLLIAGIIYLANLYQAISDETDIDKNKLAYVFTVVVLIATFVVAYILPKILF